MAQEKFSSDSFEAITIRKAKELELDTKTFQITNITGPVDLTLISKEEANNLDLKADVLEIRYADDISKSPSFIYMEGNVDIFIQGRKILSDKADIDLENGLAVFTGKIIVTLPDSEPITAKRMTLNMNTSKLTLTDMIIPRLSITDPTP